MWERGLKQCTIGICTTINMSLPMWERGLKLSNHLTMEEGKRVAPHVGAWIETTHS